MAAVRKSGSIWTGEVTAVDGRGNLVTNFMAGDVAALARVSKVWFDLGDHQTGTLRGLANSYSDGEPGKLLAIAGSKGFVEISVRDGSAAESTKLKVGSPVTLEFRT